MSTPTAAPPLAAAHSAAEDFSLLAERVDHAAAEVRQLPADAQTKALALQSAIEEFHKVGLARIVRTLKADPRGKELLFELAADPSVYALFAMHGLVRADIRTRVARVIEMVRPYMRSHGGDVELADVAGDTVYVRLSGACHGCSMSAQTLRNSVEEALREHVPEVRAVEHVAEEPVAAFVPLDLLTGEGAGWIAGPRAEELEEGRPFRMETPGGEETVVLLKLSGKVQAFRNRCAHMGLPIDGGYVDTDAGTLTCPWHGFRFDGVTGECLTAPHAQLEAFPLRIDQGVIKVRPQ